jgi:sugar-specific transcriptional regulator TrmB/DNA-binding CsgD family transcriptional regulator
MPTDEVAHLTTLGLEPNEALVYSTLLSTGTATARHIAGITGESGEQVAATFAALIEAGLVSAATEDRRTVTPVPPTPGLDLLTRRRQAELDRARVATINAFSRFRHAASGENRHQVTEVIRGPLVHERASQIERAAKDRVRVLESPPYYSRGVAHSTNVIELDNLQRGVRYEVVYAKAALECSEHLTGNVLPSVKAGEQARTLPEVAVKLLVVDDSHAVVSLSDDEGDIGLAALLVRPSSLLSGLVGLFTLSWRAALPLGIRDSSSTANGGPYLRPSELRLLGLLATGLGDDQVARALHVSRRTLYRYLEGLMSRTGAENRFQLAVHAARNGWI